MNAVRVEFGVQEDARRAVFAALDGLPDRQRARLAGSVAAALRDAGHLAGSVEQHYSASQVAERLGRCPEYVIRAIKRGDFGPVAADGGGWLVPASGVNRWLAARVFVNQAKEAA